MLATVTLNTDTGVAGELRTEITNAAPGDTIDFQLSSGDETVLLSPAMGELVVDKPLTINGDNAGGSGVPVTISGGGSVRVFNVDDGTAAAVAVTMSDLTITGGNATTGGGIQNAEDLRLVGATVSGNSATAGPGGGISSSGVGSNLTLSDNSVVDDNYAYAVDYNGGGGIFSSLGTMTITDSMITNNRATGMPGTFFTGGGISTTSIGAQYAPLDVTISRSVISGNSVFGVDAPNAPDPDIEVSPYGGGFSAYGYGTVIISDTTLSENSATGSNPDNTSYSGGATGGGMSLFSSPYSTSGDALEVQLVDSLVSANYSNKRGGGIAADTYFYGPAPLDFTITNTTISDNSTTQYGGGLWAYGAGTINGDFNVTITGSTISGNSSRIGGGISNWNNGYLYLESSTVSGNSASDFGGGIGTYGFFLNYLGVYQPKLVVSNSTVSGNSANGLGGGLYSFESNLEIRNSTISGNTAGTDGAGLYVYASVAYTAGASALIQNSTFTENVATGYGGGITVTGYHENWSMSNTIVSGNTAATSPDVDDLSSAYAVRDNTTYSLIGDNAGSYLAPANPDANGNIVGGTGASAIDAMLGTLGDNGGTTQTHELLAGSPAIDAGDPAAMAGVGSTPEFDQRGMSFGRVEDGDGDMTARIDMGAFEVQPTLAVDGDFNDDGLWDCTDINMLSAAIATNSTDLAFDMNQDGVITLADITDPGVGWLAVGGAAPNNTPQTGGNAFINGDATLDGAVDVSDFSIWNGSKFTAVAAWCSGDFNADGVVDVSDFAVWNASKFTSSFLALAITSVTLEPPIKEFKADPVVPHEVAMKDDLVDEALMTQPSPMQITHPIVAEATHVVPHNAEGTRHAQPADVLAIEIAFASWAGGLGVE